ncbi:hypothetical protein CCP3SC1AL1_900001 [Gammaproteobacteria bacterium]
MRDAEAVYKQQLAEFSSCVFSSEELNSPEAQHTVLELYDQITQSGDRCVVEVSTGLWTHELLSVWLNLPSSTFICACIYAYTYFLRSAHAYVAQPQVQAREMFVKKNADYGNVFLNLGVPGIITRLGDKVARIAALRRGPSPQVVDESLGDTLIDAANYAIMAAICHKLSRGATLSAV